MKTVKTKTHATEQRGVGLRGSPDPEPYSEA